MEKTYSPYKSQPNYIKFDSRNDILKAKGFKAIGIMYSRSSGSMLVKKLPTGGFYVIKGFFNNRRTEYAVEKISVQDVKAWVRNALQFQFALVWMQGKEHTRKVIDKVKNELNKNHALYDYDA